MIKDEALIRSFLDNTLKETERHYVSKRLESDTDFKSLFDDISLYYDVETITPKIISTNKKPKFATIPVQPLPKKYTNKLKLKMLLQVVLIVAIVWVIMHYFFGNNT